MLMALIMPDWSKAAWKALSAPANVPVWDEAALAPAAVPPALTTIRGFFLAAFLASSMNSLPFSTPSRYPRITDVSESSARYWISSSSERSALLPREMNLEKPTLFPTAQSRMAVHRAPDWEKKAISPLGGIPAANDALSMEPVSMRPRQFG